MTARQFRDNEAAKTSAMVQQLLQASLQGESPGAPIPTGAPTPSPYASPPPVGDVSSPAPSIEGGAGTAVFHSALNKMIAASGGKLSIKSGTRTPERQAQLYAAALQKYGSPEAARKWVAPPGHSNHERGLAVDLGFSDPAAIAWAHQNAGQYGLTFPLSNENWHIEPLGARGQRK